MALEQHRPPRHAALAHFWGPSHAAPAGKSGAQVTLFATNAPAGQDVHMPEPAAHARHADALTLAAQHAPALHELLAQLRDEDPQEAPADRFTLHEFPLR